MVFKHDSTAKRCIPVTYHICCCWKFMQMYYMFWWKQQIVHHWLN